MNTIAWAFPTLMLVGGGCAGLVIGFAAIKKWPMLVLWATGAFAVIAWEIPASLNLATIGGTQIKIEDALFVLFTLATVARPQGLVSMVQRYAIWMSVIAICLVTSLIAGILIYGPAAINEARPYFWGVGLVAWMLSQDWSNAGMQARLRQWATVLGWALVLVFVYHVARYGMGTADSFVEVGDGNSQTGRPLISQQAAMLTCAGLMMFWRTDQFRPRALAGVVFLVVAALCQHRSVWAGIGIALVFAVLKLRGKALGNTVFWGLYGCLVLSIFLIAGAFNGLIEQLAHAATSAGTYNERADSWQLLIEQAVAKGTLPFGEPFGTGYARVVDGRFITYSPHNWFVMILLRLGLPGIVSYLVVMAGLVLPKLLRSNHVAASALIAILVYSWTYSMPWYLSAFIGWCIYESWKNGVIKSYPSSAASAALPKEYVHLARRRASEPLPLR